MFQRLKGAIDSRIAEEQARQRVGTSPSRSSSAARRSNSLADSPARRPGRGRPRPESIPPAGKGPDPADFEPEFVVGGDDETPDISRTGTPRPEDSSEETAAPPSSRTEADRGREKTLRGSNAEEGKMNPPEGENNRNPVELPTEVRVKLRKLDKLEVRYQELLKAYRVAHARVLSIEPFEASLRENTPLTSIGDPSALTEYLNQLNLKGDMVLDELKRVSSERDDWKNKLQAAEKSARDAWDEVKSLTSMESSMEKPGKGANESIGSTEVIPSKSSPDAAQGAAQRAPISSPKSRTSSIPSLSLFSPKSKPTKPASTTEESEEFFSYDSELPRLESELKEREGETVQLKAQVQTLKGDLSVARESTESMVQSLESATRELHTLRDGRDRHESEVVEHKKSFDLQVADLKDKLAEAEKALELKRSSSELITGDADANPSGAEDLTMITPEKGQDTETVKQLEVALMNSEAENVNTTRKVETMSGLVNHLRGQVKEMEGTMASLKLDISQKEENAAVAETSIDDLKAQLEEEKSKYIGSNLEHRPDAKDAVDSMQDASKSEPIKPLGTDPSGSGKKKNKKKKKTGKSALDATKDTDMLLNDSVNPESRSTTSQPNAGEVTSQLQLEIDALRSELSEKDAAIERMHSKLKDQEGLQEEIETLKDEVVNVGQEHVEVKDRVKVLLAEKAALEESVQRLETELVDLRISSSLSRKGSDKEHDDLNAEFEDLKVRSMTLQTDLTAAQKLAASRFKDLTDLRDILHKMQPELKSLKAENEEYRGFRDKLKNKASELRRLESKHEDLQAEMKGVKSAISERDTEIKVLNHKINQESSGRIKAEEALGVAQSDLRYSEAAKQDAVESNEKVSKELSKAQEELRTLRGRLRDIEDQVAQLGRDAESLREELQLKTAQYASAQSLMSSMRDQTSELAMQMKEARERCDSLEEELSDTHRLLSERSREAETMRRLLADVEGRADSKVREMKERMEAAVEERDRAEEEASTTGRRRAREAEELKAKVRDAERALKRAEDDREELEQAQKEWKRRREELETKSERSATELNDVRQAMTELQNALDESEQQARDLEGQKSELRRAVEEAQHKLGRLQKSNKSMADELRTLQTPRKKPAPTDSGVQSSRSSIDSGVPPRSGVGSPVPPRVTNSSNKNDASGGAGGGNVDYVYLKNVLLQFLEQKDKNHQKQLIPVLAMLLHFDGKDEQKWMSAITSK